MGPGAAAFALGGLGVFGTILTNRQNRDMAREQMNFQERMSSTSVRRAVEDYKAAGLNPALAYDRSASSPSGASATMGDAAASGISTAQAARALQQQMRIAADQNEADKAVKKSQEYKNMHDADLSFEQKMEMQRIRNFNLTVEPATRDKITAESKAQNLILPGLKNTADFEKMMGKARPGIVSAKTLAEVLKMLGPERRP